MPKAIRKISISLHVRRLNGTDRECEIDIYENEFKNKWQFHCGKSFSTRTIKINKSILVPFHYTTENECLSLESTAVMTYFQYNSLYLLSIINGIFFFIDIAKSD